MQSSGAPNFAIVNARVWTGDARRPWANAVAVAGEYIAAVGSSAEVRKMLPREAHVVDAQGRLLVPGFIDSHIHFIEGGFRLSWIALGGTHSRDDFTLSVSGFADGIRPGQWILGGDWDHENWGGELPTRDWIDSVTPGHPVWLTRHDGHMALANSRALEAAGVDAAVADPPGGAFVRDASGRLTGVVKDRAMEIVGRVIPPQSETQEDAALNAAMRHVAGKGVTAVHNMGTWENLAVFRRAHDRGKLLTRIYAAVPLQTWARLHDETERNGRGDDLLRIGALKAFVDGSLGSHTALFHEPYTDMPLDRGIVVTPGDELEEMVSAADAAGLHCITHAIGDRANTILLDVYGRVAERNGPRDRRFRVEHAQHLSAADIPRFAQLGVIASVQPYHAIDDGRWLERAVGPARARGAYAFRSLLDSGAVVAMGSDWFVAPPAPLEGIYAAVTRCTLDGMNPRGWMPQERITVEEALRGYTTSAAYAGFQDRVLGTLARGKLADMVLLDRDITAVPADEIRRCGVLLTVVGGRVVHEQ